MFNLRSLHRTKLSPVLHLICGVVATALVLPATTHAGGPAPVSIEPAPGEDPLIDGSLQWQELVDSLIMNLWKYVGCDGSLAPDQPLPEHMDGLSHCLERRPPLPPGQPDGPGSLLDEGQRLRGLLGNSPDSIPQTSILRLEWALDRFLSNQ
jgi:hypothetical protein